MHLVSNPQAFLSGPPIIEISRKIIGLDLYGNFTK